MQSQLVLLGEQHLLSMQVRGGCAHNAQCMLHVIGCIA
jgi:hypothetical protein